MPVARLATGLTFPDVELGKVIFVSQVQDKAFKITGVAIQQIRHARSLRSEKMTIWLLNLRTCFRVTAFVQLIKVCYAVEGQPIYLNATEVLSTLKPGVKSLFGKVLLQLDLIEAAVNHGPYALIPIVGCR